MPESTLSLSIDDLKGSIGHFLGYGRGTPYGEVAWTTPQTNDIVDVLKSGLSQFYTPPALPGERESHSWSFMRPFTTIALSSGESVAVLPDGFGSFEGPLYITTDSTAWRRFPLDIYNEGMVQARHASLPDTTGAPKMAALQVIAGTSALEGTRYRLYVWPVADADYTFAAEYKYLPDMLTGSFPYPPGGQEHAETLKSACLAAAELHLDDVKGPRWEFFMQRLAASVAVDSRKKGTKFGYNGDSSDRRFPPGRGWRDYDNAAVTYNGNPL